MKKYLLLLSVLSGFALFYGCQKELSFENGGTPSEGSLKSDLTGDCLPKTVAGVYEAGTALTTTNYIDVTVDVVQAGSYLVYTDTVNGIYFRSAGIFTATGLNTVRLKGNGTPVVAGISNYLVTYGLTACTVAVTIVPAGGSSPAVFTLSAGTGGDCMGANVQGTYTQGTALTAANKVDINVNVTTIGTYNVSTTATGGMTFSGTGSFTTTGPQTITLAGTGTPTTAGTTNIPVTVGTSSCSFPVTVIGPATYTINCGTAVVNGTYAQGVALTSSNTVSIQVNAATIGGYTITGTINGMTFSKSGSFTVTGAQTITLDGSGTPAAGGTFNVPLTGGTAPCNFPVTVSGPATYTVNCGSAVVNGTYAQGVALTTSNTVSIQVNVATIGGYTITGTINGMTFSKSGSFTVTGAQTITLAGSGTPAAGGTFNVPLTGGTAPCNFPVTVTGPANFTVNCGSAIVNGNYLEGVALNSTNTVDIQVNAASVGPYTITGTINGMTFSKSGNFTVTGAQTITLAGSGTPVADGTFNVPINSGSTPCTFSVTVDPTFGSWQFTQGSTTYSGIFTDAGFDNTSFPPYLIFYCYGLMPNGVEFEIDLVDVSGTVTTESYNMATFTGAANSGGMYYTGIPPKTYEADPSMTGNTMVANVTNHNTTTKTITGTFSGKAFDENGVLRDITSGTFTATYP